MPGGQGVLGHRYLGRPRPCVHIHIGPEKHVPVFPRKEISPANFQNA